MTNKAETMSSAHMSNAASDIVQMVADLYGVRIGGLIDVRAREGVRVLLVAMEAEALEAGRLAGIEAAAQEAALAEYPMMHERGITFNPSMALRIRALATKPGKK